MAQYINIILENKNRTQNIRNKYSLVFIKIKKKLKNNNKARFWYKMIEKINFKIVKIIALFVCANVIRVILFQNRKKIVKLLVVEIY